MTAFRALLQVRQGAKRARAHMRVCVCVCVCQSVSQSVCVLGGPRALGIYFQLPVNHRPPHTRARVRHYHHGRHLRGACAPQVQRAALAGVRMDVHGNWAEPSWFVYHPRLTLLAAEAGQALWRGNHDVDGPFYNGHLDPEEPPRAMPVEQQAVLSSGD